ncbi:MAG: DUF4230 domain-containing protein [Phycisphaeraceae bacterium]|nr:DUF4230 domain-containing protein [Phycisphaeraceae bacterium]
MALHERDQREPVSWRFLGALGLAAAALFAALAVYIRGVERSVVESETLDREVRAAPPGRDPAQLAGLVRTMRLVTVEIDTTVTSTAGDESWRGDVSAKLSAPVRLYYGTDLAGLGPSDVSAGPLGGVIVRVPRPRRLATEIYPEREDPEVLVGWLRFRSRAGEYYLSQARRDLAEHARQMPLSRDDLAKVEQATRDQITALLRAMLGDDKPISVIFTDDRGGVARSRVHAPPGLTDAATGDGK